MITPKNACVFSEWMLNKFKIPVSLLSDEKENITGFYYVYGLRWNKDPKYAKCSITNEITDEQQKEILNKIQELFGKEYKEMSVIQDGCPESLHFVTLQKMKVFKMDSQVPWVELSLNLKKKE